MANLPPNSSYSQSGSRNPRIARRNSRVPRAAPYPTLPALASRLDRHEQQIRGMDIDLQEARENWSSSVLGQFSQVFEDHETTVNNLNTLNDRVEETVGTMSAVYNQVVGNHNEVSVLQSRLRETETRLFETEGNVRELERQLREAIGTITRLTANLERVVTLLPPSVQPPNPQQD